MLASAKSGSSVAALAGLKGKLASPGMIDAAAALKLSDTDMSKPLITQDPQNQSAPLGSSVTLSVQSFSSEPISLQWYKNDSKIVAANSSQLKFSKLSMADQGSYYCVVSAAGQQAKSAVAQISILDRANADINGDGTVNFADVIAFFPQFGKNGDALSADLDGNGTVDMSDLTILLKALKG